MSAKTATMRLDDRLVELGLCADRQEALRRVLAHEVKVEDSFATSAAIKVSAEDHIEVKGSSKYVSRGGFKLEGALDAFGVDVSGKRCLDIGSSTGGFTDCLLQAGAASVACVDVNYGELAWKIRTDERVSVFERTNIKHANPAEIGAPFDLIVIDVSFIGLAKLCPIFPRFMHVGSEFLGLIKPQFESKHDETDRGIVRDEGVRVRTVSEVSEALCEQGFEVKGVVESPIKGASGNVEFLILAEFVGISDAEGER